jgi:hypothetical protein
MNNLTTNDIIFKLMCNYSHFFMSSLLIDYETLKHEYIEYISQSSYKYDEDEFNNSLYDLVQKNLIHMLDDDPLNPNHPVKNKGTYYVINFEPYILNILKNKQIKTFEQIYVEFEQIKLIKNNGHYRLDGILKTMISNNKITLDAVVTYQNDGECYFYEKQKYFLN